MQQTENATSWLAMHETAVRRESVVSTDLVSVGRVPRFRPCPQKKGFPPKIVWVTRGNSSTEQIAGLLRANTVRISELHTDPEAGYLMLR
jgi:predicted nuclease of predicted toxin-antitoxin system